VPAAAVIPAPIAYIKVVAGKKLVVGSHKSASARVAVSLRFRGTGSAPGCYLFAGDLTRCPLPGAAAAQ
jgi:hypothetical protein